MSFSDEQWANLQAAFPSGVCDYTKPGVSQQPPKARWLTFADGPGGRALGPAPGATEFAPGTVGGTVPATLSLSVGSRELRRLHAGCGEGLHGDHDRNRHVHGR